jgi:hypothetical protein
VYYFKKSNNAVNWVAILHYPSNLSKIRCKYFFL